MARATTSAPACQLPHLPEGCYPIAAEDHRRLVELATSTAAAVDRALQAERDVANRARADLLTSIHDGHKDQLSTLTGLLEDSRAENKDREERIRQLMTERHADIGKLADSLERTVKAEARDASIAAADNKDLRQAQLGLYTIQANAELWGKGLSHIAHTLGPVVPMLAASALGQQKTTGAGGSSGAPVVDASIVDADPPPLPLALVQLLWRVRAPDVVALLGRALVLLSTQPALQGLGAALQEQAPEAFAAVVAVLAQQQAQASAASPSTPGGDPATPNPQQ